MADHEWKEAELHVMLEIERHGKCLDEIKETLGSVRRELSFNRGRSSLWGGGMGVLACLAAEVARQLFG